MAKAFNTVEHTLLLEKLQYYGIRGKAIEWVKDYLENRPQRVIYNNIKSDKQILNYGVPQGTILGPLFHIIYINDINKLINNNNQLTLYADDTNMLTLEKSENEVYKNCHKQIYTLNQWINDNMLTLNNDKTFYMFYHKTKTKNGKDNNTNNEPNKIDRLNINGIPIEQTKKINFLGIIIDEKLKFNEHTYKIINKLKLMCHLTYKLKNKINNKDKTKD